MEKPKLEHKEKQGQYGEIVVELTPESEILWAEYLRKQHFLKVELAKRAINENNVDGTSSFSKEQ